VSNRVNEIGENYPNGFVEANRRPASDQLSGLKPKTSSVTAAEQARVCGGLSWLERDENGG
jgi:hypothetical protein